MCPWVGPHAPSFGRQPWGLPSRVEYLSPQGVLLPLVYGTTASPLWLELRGHSAWQASPSWAVYRLACHRLLRWLRVTFAMVPDAAWPGSDQPPWSTAPATGPVHKADTEDHKKVHGSKKRAPASVREAKVEVTKDELSKLMSVGTELAKEIQEIKRAWVPKSEDKNKDKEKRGKKGGKKKGVNEVDAEESTPTPKRDAP